MAAVNVTVNVNQGGQMIISEDKATTVVEQMNYFDTKTCDKKVPKTSRAMEYRLKWDGNMFLNDFDAYDENAGINIKLKEVYLESHLPHFKLKDNDKLSFGLKELLHDYIDKVGRRRMLLILGQPGIGKSTLITWILANFVDRFESILVYQFASDLKGVEWNNTSAEYDIAEELWESLGLSTDSMEGKVLILDGFDEVIVDNNRGEILNQIYRKWIRSGQCLDFSLIVTCRENYIENLHRLQFTYITLQLWDNVQIKSFFKIYQEKTNNFMTLQINESILEKEGILGIPLILYMVLALNIPIVKTESIVDVYERIFSLEEGGIYERCIKNREYAAPHRICRIREQVHQISREIAIWIFENNPNKEYIQQEEYQKICSQVMESNGQDFLIANFFKLVKHCEGIGSEKLYFVHRSIYEYFVVESIYSAIENSMKDLSEGDMEDFAGGIAPYLRLGKITPTIGEYFKHKVLKLYDKLSREKKERFYSWWEDAIGKMMAAGMFYYTKKNISEYSGIIALESCCFNNLLILLRFLGKIRGGKYILENIDWYLIRRYVKNYLMECDRKSYLLDLSRLNLRKMELSGINAIRGKFKGANLKGVDLSHAYLIGADFSGADMEGACLLGANLRGAHFDGTIIRGVCVKGADLRGTTGLTEKDLRGLDLTDTII